MKKFIKMLCQVLNDYCTVLFVRKPLVAGNIGVGVFTMVTNEYWMSPHRKKTLKKNVFLRLHLNKFILMIIISLSIDTQFVLDKGIQYSFPLWTSCGKVWPERLYQDIKHVTWDIRQLGKHRRYQGYLIHFNDSHPNSYNTAADRLVCWSLSWKTLSSDKCELNNKWLKYKTVNI